MERLLLFSFYLAFSPSLSLSVSLRNNIEFLLTVWQPKQFFLSRVINDTDDSSDLNCRMIVSAGKTEISKSRELRRYNPTYSF